MKSWQQYKEVKETLNENHANFARMAADSAMRAAGSSGNTEYFMDQCKKAMGYLEQAMGYLQKTRQAGQSADVSQEKKDKIMKAFQRGIISQKEMEFALAQLGG